MVNENLLVVVGAAEWRSTVWRNVRRHLYQGSCTEGQPLQWFTAWFPEKMVGCWFPHVFESSSNCVEMETPETEAVIENTVFLKGESKSCLFYKQLSGDLLKPKCLIVQHLHPAWRNRMSLDNDNTGPIS